MIVDSHCHAWRRWPYDAAVPDPGHRGSVEALLHEMDQNDVERAAVVCARIGHEIGPDCANDDNNEYVAAAAERQPDRLMTVADIDCRSPIAAAFGPHRLAWASHFPASRPHLTYTQTLAVVRDHTPWWTDDERALVLGGTIDWLLRGRRPLAETSVP